MKRWFCAGFGALLSLAPAAASPLAGQDTIPAPTDTIPSDSAAAALQEELRRLLGDSTNIPLPDAPRPVPRAAAVQNLNPDISAIGELLIDLSPEEARFVESGARFEVREVELGIQAVVDPFFRADFFLGLHPEEVEIEEAYLTALALGAGWQARLGKFHLPFGKVNLTHRPELFTVDYPTVIREYFGEEGFGSTGVGFSKVIDWLGFFQELQLYGIAGIQREEHAHGDEEGEEEVEIVDLEERDVAEQVAVLGHLRNYWDLSPAANLELGFSAAYGSVEHLEPRTICPIVPPCFEQLERTFEPRGFYGTDVTVRWRPPGRAIYRSFIWNTELVLSDGPDGARHWGGFTQAQWQTARRWYVGGRFDAVQPVEDEHAEAEESATEWLYGVSGYLTWFPSEFSRFKLALERTFGEAAEAEVDRGGAWRAVLQATFAIGPHRPHAF